MQIEERLKSTRNTLEEEKKEEMPLVE